MTNVQAVILPQSPGWGRVLENGCTELCFPAADGSEPLEGERLHEMDTGLGSDVDCSEQHRYRLKKYNIHAF